MLRDLMRIARASKEKRISLVLKIDKFLYIQQKNLMEGLVSEKSVRLKEARTELAVIKKKIQRWKLRTSHNRAIFFHPSTLADCARQTVYSYLGAPTNKVAGYKIDELGKTARIFGTGDYFHIRMQVLMILMGLCTVDDIEVPFEEGDRQGTCDAIINLDGQRVVVDFKSANDYSFMSARKSNSAGEKYEAQTRMYMKELGIKKGIILYENKNNQELVEFVYDLRQEHVTQINDRLEYLRRHIKAKKLPEGEGEGLSRMPCKYCAFSNICIVEKKETKRWLKSLRSTRKAGPDRV